MAVCRDDASQYGAHEERPSISLRPQCTPLARCTYFSDMKSLYRVMRWPLKRALSSIRSNGPFARSTLIGTWAFSSSIAGHWLGSSSQLRLDIREYAVRRREWGSVHSLLIDAHGSAVRHALLVYTAFFAFVAFQPRTVFLCYSYSHGCPRPSAAANPHRESLGVLRGARVSQLARFASLSVAHLSRAEPMD